MAKNDSKNDKRVTLTTGIGTLSFVHIFKETVSTNDDGEKVYETQFLIPKSQREDIKKIHAAIKEVAQAKWGDNYRSVRSPLRDGDAEKKMLAEDGQTRGEKYPERLGCFFLNARSKKPIAVLDRDKNVIDEPSEVYGGAKGRLNITFYPYITKGNQGVGAGLNAVQKTGDGEAFSGAGKPDVDSMFDMLDDDDDYGDGLDEPKGKKGKAKGKKADPEPEQKAKKKSKKK